MRTPLFERIPVPIAKGLVASALAALMLGACALVMDSALDALQAVPSEDGLTTVRGRVLSVGPCTGGTQRRPPHRMVVLKDMGDSSAVRFPCLAQLTQIPAETAMQVKFRRSRSSLFAEEEVWDARTPDATLVAYDVQRSRRESLSWWRALRTCLLFAAAALLGKISLVAWREYASRRR